MRNAILATVFFSIPVLAQRDITGTQLGLASIQGRVVLQDAPSAAPEQIPVHLTQSNGVPVAVAYTSGNGQFLFNNLATGNYEIRVSAPGFHPVSHTVNVNTASGRIQTQVYLRRLEPRARTDPAATSASISMREMLAPPGARREYEKGLEKLRKVDFPAAERHLKKAVAIHPAYSRAWVELGQLYARTSRSGEALKSFREGLRQDDQNRDAWLYMARLLNDQGQHLEALQAAARLEQQYARDPRNHLEIARGLLGVGKIPEAEAAARRLDTEPHAEVPEVHLVLFHILRLRQDKQAAAAELRTYLKEISDSGVPSTVAPVVRARDLLAKLETEIATAK